MRVWIIVRVASRGKARSLELLTALSSLGRKCTTLNTRHFPREHKTSIFLYEACHLDATCVACSPASTTRGFSHVHTHPSYIDDSHRKYLGIAYFESEILEYLTTGLTGFQVDPRQPRYPASGIRAYATLKIFHGAEKSFPAGWIDPGDNYDSAGAFQPSYAQSPRSSAAACCWLPT